MVTVFTVLKSIHVLAAVFWVGSGFLMNVAIALAGRAQDPARRLATLRLADFAGLKIFIPLALIVLGTGIWMTADHYRFGDPWIVLSLIGTAYLILVILLYMVPRTHAAVVAMEQAAGPPAKPSRLPQVARLNLLVGTVIVVIMVIKPG